MLTDQVTRAVAWPSEPTRGRTRLTVLALVSGLLALACAMALPVAPVDVNKPAVAWPNDPAAPESTTLMLGAYRPLGLDARFSCRTIGAAADGVVLATVDPRVAADAGLVVTANAGRLAISLRGKQLLDAPVPAGACEYRIAGDASTALAVTLAGHTVASGQTGTLPDVDMLVTGAAAVPGGTAADLSVRLRVDDEFATTPTPVKIALSVLMLLAAAVAVGCLVAMDRSVERGPAARRRFRLRVVDVVVPLTMIGWLVLAPPTDDDGYYGAMAKNVTFEGYVGQYYQLHNQGFTPFTWFYVFLSAWQRMFGYAPVVLRIPALVFGLITWWAVRRLVDGRRVLPPALRETRWGPVFVRVLLAAAFLTWWLPLDMGIRPESVVTMCGAVTLLAVCSAIERRRLTLVAVAIGVSAVGVVAHPTGLTALAPILAGLPGIWRLIRPDGAGIRPTVARVAGVLAPGALAAFAAFADGSLRDFIRGQQIFLRIQSQESWYTEYLRYQFLLQHDPMGNYAKRAAVLICVVALIWFVLLMVAARVRSIEVPGRLALAGWSTLAMFLLLWPTPSKWTHHFGALAGIGSVFLVLMLVGFVPLVRELTRDGKLPVPAMLLGLGSVVAALALAGHGPNLWPYNWMFGMPHDAVPPGVWKFRLDSVVLLTLGLGLLAYLIHRWTRTRRPDWRRYSALIAVPLLVLAFLVANVAHLLGTFAVATARTWDTFSVSQAAVRDPLGRDCVAASAIDVLDDRSATPLPALANQWFELPATLPESGAVATRFAGSTLTVEYGRRSGTEVTPLGGRAVGDGYRGPGWRNLVLDDGTARPTGADAIRLVAVDGAITAPSLQRAVPLTRYLPADAAVAVSWQLAFVFPCQRQPEYRDGIIEPVTYGVQWSATPFGMLTDGTWMPFRGGLFGQVPRTSSMTLLTARFRDFPGQKWLQVYRFEPKHPAGRYAVTTSTETRLGVGR